MTRKIQNQYSPDYISPPGDTILELTNELSMSQVELAQRMGRPIKTINEIIHGKAQITPETAIQFEKIFSVPADFWLTLEKQYREFLARKIEDKKLQESLSWSRQIPINEMIKAGWINKINNETGQIHEALQFYAVASHNQWENLWGHYRANLRESATYKSELGPLSAWLRQGEIEALKIDCDPYSESEFKNALSDIRKLTTESPDVFVPELQNIGSKFGVAVVFLPELRGTHLYGATRWISPQKALIQLSLRDKSNDHLWFTFFHEAAHILLHKKKDIFIELRENDNDDEKEANKFASDFLIPPKEYHSFVNNAIFNILTINEFASSIGIAPGIVVGRLQHDKHIQYKSPLNRLKARYVWN